MSDVSFADLTTLRLWIIVLALSAIGIIEKTAIFYTGERKGDAVPDGLPGLTFGRKDQMKKLSERWGSIIMILASIPLAGTVAMAVSEKKNNSGDLSRRSVLIDGFFHNSV